MSVLRGIIHFHSAFSNDGNIPLENIASKAAENSLDFLILTEHNTIQSSVELNEIVNAHQFKIQVPIAAEYKTEYGDVIAAFIHSEITEMKFAEFVRQVRSQEGLILFPHPFASHTCIEAIAREADLIEIFNGRMSNEKNRKSEQLAVNFGKKGYFSSDAHIYRNLFDAVVYVEPSGGLRNSLLSSEIFCPNPKKTRNIDILQSYYIKAIKTNDMRRFFKSSRRLLRWTVTGKIFRKI